MKRYGSIDEALDVNEGEAYTFCDYSGVNVPSTAF